VGDRLCLVIAVEVPWQLRKRRVGATANDDSILLGGHRRDVRAGFLTVAQFAETPDQPCWPALPFGNGSTMDPAHVEPGTSAHCDALWTSGGRGWRVLLVDAHVAGPFELCDKAH
jgi:hypothetical protein